MVCTMLVTTEETRVKCVELGLPYTVQVCSVTRISSDHLVDGLTDDERENKIK